MPNLVLKVIIKNMHITKINPSTFFYDNKKMYEYLIK